MATPAPARTTEPELSREVLMQSWAMLSVYDRTASGLKRNYIRRRVTIIGLTLIATIASVLTGIIGQNSLAVLLAILSVSLPIVGSYMMNDIIKFTGTNSWIKYRFIAEMMRMELFLYRMHAGIYAAGLPDMMDDLLNDRLITIREEVKMDEVIPPTVSEPATGSDIIAAITEANSCTPGDDGLSEIKLEDYIRWRIDSQRAWYDGKVHDDFARLKFFVRWSQAFLLAGALLSALAGFLTIQVVTLVAVTNAMSVALTSWSNVGMFGKTYGIFQIASQQLADQKRRWHAIENNAEFKEPAKRKIEIANFVVRVENVLQWERQEWYEMALQAQTGTDKLILGDLTRLTQRAQDAQQPPRPENIPG